MAEVDDGMASLGRERTVNQEDEVERSDDQTPEKVEAAQVSHQLKKQKRQNIDLYGAPSFVCFQMMDRCIPTDEK